MLKGGMWGGWEVSRPGAVDLTKFDEVCPGAVDDASRAERLFDSEAMTEQRRAAEALWLELEACQAAVSACYPSAEQLREEAAEAERLAQRDGIPPKSAAVIHSLKRRWVAFLETHGDEYSFDAAAGPTIELAVTFQTHGYHERLTFSTVDDSGMGDSCGVSWRCLTFWRGTCSR